MYTHLFLFYKQKQVLGNPNASCRQSRLKINLICDIVIQYTCTCPCHTNLMDWKRNSIYLIDTLYTAPIAISSLHEWQQGLRGHYNVIIRLRRVYTCSNPSGHVWNNNHRSLAGQRRKSPWTGGACIWLSANTRHAITSTRKNGIHNQSHSPTNCQFHH